MTSVLRALLLIFAICFLLAIIRLVKNGRLQLKYSLLWMFLACVLVVCAVFPGLVGACANALGVGLASNFVFLVGLILLMGITLSLTVIVSWQARDIRSLVQRLALLEKELKEDDISGGTAR